MALRRVLLHELFHRVQPQLGLMVVDRPNDPLDTIGDGSTLALDSGWTVQPAARADDFEVRRARQ